MELGVGRFPQPSIEDEIGIKVALSEPMGKAGTSRQLTTRLVCPICKQPVEKRTRIVDGKITEETYYCTKCEAKDLKPLEIQQIENVPLLLNEQFTRDSTTGFYDEIDALDVSLLDSLMNTLKYLNNNANLNLGAAHQYFLDEKTKCSSISKSRGGQLVKAILTHRVETAEKIEQSIKEETPGQEKTGWFGGMKK